jgi:hypothetical protein
METLFKLFINRGNLDDSFVEVIIHICMVSGYDLLCDLLEILNLIIIGSVAATRRNLVDPIQRTNMRGLMAGRFCARKALGSNPHVSFFHFIFFHLFFIFICNFFSTYLSMLSPFFSSIDFL